MRMVAALFLVLALSGCETDFDKWHEQAVKECEAKPNTIDKQQCLDQVAAVERTRQPGGVGPEPSK